MINILHRLAHSHWQMGPKGSYAFFYKHLRSLGLEKAVDYRFNWGNIRDMTIVDDQGRVEYGV